jgi:hypothetical protein
MYCVLVNGEHSLEKAQGWRSAFKAGSYVRRPKPLKSSEQTLWANDPAENNRIIDMHYSLHNLFK